MSETTNLEANPGMSLTIVDVFLSLVHYSIYFGSWYNNIEYSLVYSIQFHQETLQIKILSLLT